MQIKKHNWKKYPELTNKQMETLYFQSPHKQITSDFQAKVTKVSDGDTIRVKCKFRDFDFPIRFKDIDTPELDEPKGEEIKKWLNNKIYGKDIEVKIDPKFRVCKFGRLLGKIVYAGEDIGQTLMSLGMAKPFKRKNEGKIPEAKKTIPNLKEILS